LFSIVVFILFVLIVVFILFILIVVFILFVLIVVFILFVLIVVFDHVLPSFNTGRTYETFSQSFVRFCLVFNMAYLCIFSFRLLYKTPC